MDNNTILIIGDASVQGEPQVALRERGYATIVARDSADAARVIAGRRVDLVLLDAERANRAGLKAVTEIRHRCPGVPMVVLTSSSSEETKREALDRGANGYLEKPVNVDVLRRLVERILAR